MESADHASPAGPRPDGGEDVDVVEVDPEGRYHRYPELVGRGKFKSCHKAFDSQIGIDVAWSKYTADDIHLSDMELSALESDIQTNLDLEHPNIIKSFRCWGDMQHHCINLITELFTSGNLRQFRAHYLHSLSPPITHGDLRCDKIYVNGNSGEIKIGDIGLATLVPYRWEGAEPPCGAQDPLNISSDIFAFGLVMLELLTLKQLDPQHCSNWEELLATVEDEDARSFVGKCLRCSVSQRPTADELLVDGFLAVPRKVTMNGGETAGVSGSHSDLGNVSLSASSKSLHDVMVAGASTVPITRPAEDMQREDPSSMEHGSAEAPIAVGKLRGEDYEFEFGGKVIDGKMNFRLVMTQASSGSASTSDETAFRRTIDFTFDPDVDTVDTLASEISETFNLSPTDTEICAAALREWLAKEMPHLTDDGDGNRG